MRSIHWKWSSTSTANVIGLHIGTTDNYANIVATFGSQTVTWRHWLG